MISISEYRIYISDGKLLSSHYLQCVMIVSFLDRYQIFEPSLQRFLMCQGKYYGCEAWPGVIRSHLLTRLISSEFIGKWPINNYTILFVLALIKIRRSETVHWWNQIIKINSARWATAEDLNFVENTNFNTKSLSFKTASYFGEVWYYSL